MVGKSHLLEPPVVSPFDLERPSLELPPLGKFLESIKNVLEKSRHQRMSSVISRTRPKTATTTTKKRPFCSSFFSFFFSVLP